MKLKILYPIVVLLLLLFIAGIAIGIYNIFDGYTKTAIFIFIIPAASLILIIYFVLNIIRLSKASIGNVAKNMLQSWMIFLLIVFNIIILFIILNFIYIRFDFTDGNKYSISPQTVELVKKLKDDILVIEYYYNDKCYEQVNQAQVVQYVLDILKEYERVSKGLVYFTSQELNYKKHRGLIEELKNKGLVEFPLSDSKEDESKVLRGISGVILKYKNNEKVIPIVNHDIGFEYAIDTEIKKFLDTGDNGLGIICAESNKNYSEDFKFADQIIKAENKTVYNLQSGEKIPEDVKRLLIIGGDTLTDYDLLNIDQFLINGGNALVLINGVNIMIHPQMGIFGFPSENKLIKMFEHYGFKVNNDVIGDSDSYYPIPQYIEGFITERRYPVWPIIKEDNINQKEPILNDFKTITFLWPSSIDVDDSVKKNAVSLFHTTPNSWSLKDRFDLNVRQFEYPIQEAEKEYNLGYKYEGPIKSFFNDKEIPKNERGTEEFNGEIKRSGDTRFILVGNSTFLEAQYLANYRITSENEYFFLINALDWLSGKDTLIDIRKKGQFTRPLDKPKNRGEFVKNKILVIIISSFMVPLFLILLGIFINIRRYMRNKKLKNKI